MKLAKIAHRDIFSLMPDDSVDKAICLMEEHRIHHLPVVKEDTVVGMLSDRDLLVAVGWRLEIERSADGSKSGVVGPARVSEIMSRPVLSLSPENHVHTAARMMAEGKFHAFPLVNHGRLVGLVTSTDLLRLFREHTPFGRTGRLLNQGVGGQMRTVVHTIGPKDSLHEAAKTMRTKNIRHLPVVAGVRLVGVISDRDIRRACGRETIEDDKAESTGRMYVRALTVGSEMTRNPVTLEQDATMHDALVKMTEHRIGCLPVIREAKLVGIVTETDLLRLIGQMDMGGDDV